MKKLARIASILLIASLILTGCSSSNEASVSESIDAESSAAASTAEEETASSDLVFSSALDDNGHFTGICASDLVELGQYKEIKIPKDKIAVSDEDVQAAIDSQLSSYSTDAQVTDRAVVDGDTVNIDYVGYIDGVAFDGGSTEGQGTSVTIGVTSYIDDFLEQLIGHKPGEDLDIEVTFPTPYELNPDYAGKDAVFKTHINYISEKKLPELTDEIVAEKFSDYESAQDMIDQTRQTLEESAVGTYLQDYMLENFTIAQIPAELTEYQNNCMLAVYKSYADSYGIDLDTFITSYTGEASTEAFLESMKDTNDKAVSGCLIYQAIAEKENISITEDDIKAYLKLELGSEDFDGYVKQYGLPYLTQVVMDYHAFTLVRDSAIIE